MKSKTAIRKILLIICILSPITKGYSQNIHPLEASTKYYKTYGTLSSSPNPVRASMNTIKFPWSKYSQGTITNSLVRTVYLSKEDEAKLPGLIKAPANSSDETRAELDYLLSLQDTRTKEQIARAQYIANIGSWFNILNPGDTDYVENKKELFYIADTIGS